MAQNISIQEYYKINSAFVPAKNILNISVGILELITGKLMECQRKILKK